MSIADYVDIVRHQRHAAASAGQDALKALDAERTRRHVQLATLLVSNGQAPNTLLARTLGHLILIHHGLDRYESAQEPFMDAVRRTTR